MRWIFPLMTLILVACGETSTKKGSTKGPSQDASGAVCNKGFCGEIKFQVESSSVIDGVLTGVDGQDVEWSFTATPQNTGSSRKVGIRFSSLPSGAKSKEFSSPALVSWIPTSRGRGESPMTVHVRDVSRCEAFEKDPEVCSDPKSVEGQSYEQTQTFAWSIGDSIAATDGSSPEVIKISDPNCGSKDSAIQGNILTQGLAAGVQVLQGMNDPAELLMKVLPSALSTVVGKDEDSKTPNPC